MKLLLSLALCLSTLQISHAGDNEILGSYTAVLGSQDHFSSKGKLLKDAASILRQDRANFHKFKKADLGDDGEIFFGTAADRASIPKLFKNGRIPASVAKEIVHGEPTIMVHVYDSKIKIDILDVN